MTVTHVSSHTHVQTVNQLQRWAGCSPAALTSPASSLAAPVFLSALLLIPTPSHLPVSTKGQLFHRLGLGFFPSSESPPQPPFSPQAINTSTRGACHIYASVGKVQLCRNLQLVSSYSPEQPSLGPSRLCSRAAGVQCRGGSGAAFSLPPSGFKVCFGNTR